jgi:type VI secretion system secreted protein VgrG
LRAQLELCKQRTCVGTSEALFFQAGKLIQVKDHYRASLNKEYLITRIRHMGGQALPGMSDKDTGEAVDYQNEFDAMPSDIEFRPSLITPKPKLYGFMSAIVDGALTSDRAQIDEHGRYKLIMPFDASGNGDGKASRWVRKAEPFGGQGTGMSFPLLKGTEVIWTCMDGDLDRPIITGVVPGTGQGANKSVVTAKNSTDNVIKTPSGIVVKMRDGKGTAPLKDQQVTQKQETKYVTWAAEPQPYILLKTEQQFGHGNSKGTGGGRGANKQQGETGATGETGAAGAAASDFDFISFPTLTIKTDGSYTYSSQEASLNNGINGFSVDKTESTFIFGGTNMVSASTQGIEVFGAKIGFS